MNAIIALAKMGELAKSKMENANVIVQGTLQDLHAKSVSANNETFSNIWQLIKDFDFFAQAFLKFLISAGYLGCFRDPQKVPQKVIPWNVCRTNIAELMATWYLTPRSIHRDKQYWIFSARANKFTNIKVSNLLCRMKISKSMKNESLPFLCFCATRFTAVAALQA